MKPIFISFIKFHMERYEKDTISEREFLDSVVDLCIERIVDLDRGRDEDTPTGVYNHSDLAAVLVEEETGRMVSSTPSAPCLTINLASDELEDCEENDAPVCPRISCRPTVAAPPMVEDRTTSGPSCPEGA